MTRVTTCVTVSSTCQHYRFQSQYFWSIWIHKLSGISAELQALLGIWSDVLSFKLGGYYICDSYCARVRASVKCPKMYPAAKRADINSTAEFGFPCMVPLSGNSLPSIMYTSGMSLTSDWKYVQTWNTAAKTFGECRVDSVYGDKERHSTW